MFVRTPTERHSHSYTHPKLLRTSVTPRLRSGIRRGDVRRRQRCDPNILTLKTGPLPASRHAQFPFTVEKVSEEVLFVDVYVRGSFDRCFFFVRSLFGGIRADIVEQTGSEGRKGVEKRSRVA